MLLPGSAPTPTPHDASEGNRSGPSSRTHKQSIAQPRRLRLTERIAVIAGDGVGPEVTEEALRVLRCVMSLDATVDLQFEFFDWGTDYYRSSGQMMPADGLDTLRTFSAILFGAVGAPDVKDYITLRQLLIRIRFGFQQYVNLRPVRLFSGVDSPIRGASPANVDMIFVRENNEGEYAGVGERLFRGTEREVALQTAVFSRHGVARVVRWAFERARSRGESLTSVSKANAMEYSGGLWDDVFDEVATEYADVSVDRLLVDAAAMLMVVAPERFKVVVASNLFADILTDLGAAIMGSMGLGASANINPERSFPSMFEPIHGSAPDIAGKGIANPLGAIWSAAMMLGHLGYSPWEDAVVDAIAAVLAAREIRTRDLGGAASTADVGTAVCSYLAMHRAEAAPHLQS
jgi:tartrate dehydrogenase/decarboxylase / D-malate dehydrogenase